MVPSFGKNPSRKYDQIACWKQTAWRRVSNAEKKGGQLRPIEGTPIPNADGVLSEDRGTFESFRYIFGTVPMGIKVFINQRHLRLQWSYGIYNL